MQIAGFAVFVIPPVRALAARAGGVIATRLQATFGSLAKSQTSFPLRIAFDTRFLSDKQVKETKGTQQDEKRGANEGKNPIVLDMEEFQYEFRAAG